MAIYHLSVKTISRSAGRSATAAIAYRAAERVMDERTGLVHDYTRRRGVEHTEIFLPENSPTWATNRAHLWNAAELAENRKNSTVAREFEVAIPAELDRGQRLELVREFARDLVQRHGMAVDVAIHEPGKDGDHRNHHAHILCSTRRLMPEGYKDKTRELDNQRSGEVAHWRERWSEVSNRHLENAGHLERIDHRSLDTQRDAAIERGDTEQAAKLDRLPTVHLGPNVVQMEQRGVRTERGDTARNIAQHNAQIINLAEARQRLDAEKEAYERNRRNGQDRPSNRSDGRPTARAGAEQPGRHTDKPDISHTGQVPPPFARGRLRNLSELGVVRFPERGEMLLPCDVPRDVEHQRAEPNHALRRGDDGLITEKAADNLTPKDVKRAWQAEKDKQYAEVASKARRVYTRAEGQMDRQERKIEAHDRARPPEPSGLIANIKKAAHVQALTAWRGIRAGLERRWTQLQKRLNLIGDYMRKAGSHEMATRGESLAEKKAAQAQPKLAANFRQVIEKEKAARIAEQRAKIEQRRQGGEKMQEKSSDELSVGYARQIEEARKRTLQKDLKRLERDGNLVERLDQQDAEQQYEENQTTKGQAAAVAKELNSDNEKGDQAKEAKKREMLERFKEKATRDRDNDRGRGR